VAPSSREDHAALLRALDRAGRFPGTLLHFFATGQPDEDRAARENGFDSLVALRGRHRWLRVPIAVEPKSPRDIAPVDPALLRDAVRVDPAVRVDAALGVRERSVWLITGGLGGMGLTIARHLAQRAQARLVLVSRTVPPRAEWPRLAGHADMRGRTCAELLEIDALGHGLIVAAADVADAGAMRSVVLQAIERFGGLHGVVHAAGVAGGELLAAKTPQASAAVLRAKVDGTRVLADVLADVRLDAVVLCSSLAALDGAAGECDYGAANAFLDAFAQQQAQRDHGARVVSIDWDTWHGVGMAEAASARIVDPARRAASLAHALSRDEGTQVFDMALASGLPQVVVSTLDLPRLLAQRRQAAAAGADHADPAHAGSVDAVAHAADPHHDAPNTGSLSGAAEGEFHDAPRSDTERDIAGLWRSLLGVERVGVHDDFLALGGHSLVATQLLSRLRQRFGVQLALKALIEARTVAATAELIERALLEEAGATDASAIDALLDDVEGLSPNELASLLRSEPAAQEDVAR
jgi:phthiocerol/phenolphthiocerol synthesis type-I polyketide synthase E